MVVMDNGIQKKMAKMTALDRYKAVRRYLGRNLVHNHPIATVPTQEPNPRIDTHHAEFTARLAYITNASSHCDTYLPN
jgi:hypothetical protein